MRALLKRLRSPLTASLVVSAVVVLGILVARSAGHFEYLELAAYDWFVRVQPEPAASESRIALIAITEGDIRALGRWPMVDATIAQALTKLVRLRPRAIGLDIYRDLPVPPGHNELNAVLAQTRNVIAVMKFGGAQASVPPPPVLRRSDQVGFNDLLLDRDGIVRRGLLFLDDGEQAAYSFPLRLALLYLQADGITAQPDPSNPQYLRLGPTTLRPLEAHDGAYSGTDARGYQILLDFQGVQTPIPSFPLAALLSDQIDPAAITGKIVLIGVTAESVPDLFHTSHSSGLGADRRAMNGVLLHAHAASQLLRAGLEGRAPIAPASKTQEMLWIMLWGLLGGALGLGVLSPWRFALSSLGGLVLLGYIVHLAFLRGWWLPFVPPALAWLIASALITAYMSSQEKNQRALLMQLFSRHVSPEIAETIWRQREQFWDGGRPRSQKMIVTVLFTDLEGFTAVAEKMDPQAMMDWTNAYHEAMAHLVMAHDGVVDDYYGDAIKANFGVPLARTTDAEIRQDAIRAVECALAMERELRRLNALWQTQHLPTVRMRVGIYTGTAVAGSLGSAHRLKYTTLGDTVNIAARLESFKKDADELYGGNSPCRILIGEATFRHLGDLFETKRLGEVSLKGKDHPITIYHVIGRKEEGAREALQGSPHEA